MYNKLARYLKDTAWTYKEDRPWENFTDRPDKYKIYWRWRSKILLDYFSPYYYDCIGERIEFEYLGYNNVLKVWMDEDWYILDQEQITIDEFIIHELPHVNLMYLKTWDFEQLLKEEIENELE